MATKSNYKNRSGFVESVTFNDYDWVRLEKIIEREFTSQEKVSIAENIDRYSAMKTSADALKVTAQNVKRGLVSFSKLPCNKVIDAYGSIHATIRAEIITAFNKMELQPKGSKPSIYKAAALLRIQEIQSSNGGRKTSGYRIELAKFILNLWKSLGRTDIKAWENTETTKVAPLVQFATAMIEMVEKDNPPSFSVVAKLMREVIA